LFDLLTEMRVIDDQIGDSGAHQPFDVPHDERLATYLQQGLGSMVGERTHTFAAPRS